VSHTKTTKPIEMPFGVWTMVGGPKEPCIRWGLDPVEEWAILGAWPGPLKSIGNIPNESKVFARWQQ